MHQDPARVAGFCFVQRPVNCILAVGVAMINANFAHPTKRRSASRTILLSDRVSAS